MKYYLQGFGFKDMSDLKHSLLIAPTPVTALFAGLVGILNVLFGWITVADIAGGLLLFILICAETHSGILAAKKSRGEKFRSRPAGRMILKVGIYLFILFIIRAFAEVINPPVIMGYDMNPFLWLYFTIFCWIVVQFLASFAENLAALGYKEASGLLGLFTRFMSKYVDVDRQKGDNEENN